MGYPRAMSATNSAVHWLIRAEDARRLAEDMNDPEAKRAMLALAAGYEKLASHAASLASTNLPTDEGENSTE